MRKIRAVSLKGANVVAAVMELPNHSSYEIANKLGCSPALVRYYRKMMGDKRKPGRLKGKPNAPKPCNRAA